MDLNKYYQEHKDDINSSIMEIASDLAEGNLMQEFKLSFEALVESEDHNNPDNGCIRYKEKYQDYLNRFYDIEYDRLAKLMNFDYASENGQMSELIELKATEMNKSELYKELDFVRSQIQIFKERTAQIDGGNWRKNVSDDFDKDALWSHYKKVISELESLLKYRYDAE